MKVIYNDKVIKENKYYKPCRECVFYMNRALYKCIPFDLPNKCSVCYGYKYEDSI